MSHSYLLVRSRRRTLALVVSPDAMLTVRAPLRMPLYQIEQFISQKRAWIERTFEKVRARPTPRTVSFAEEQWYRVQAAQIIPERVAVLAERMGVRVTKIRISSARRRWGSCSSTGTLSFSWRLIMAPSDVVDYVVVHELAHRYQLNHSSAFWKIVAAHCPDFRVREAWLKEHGHTFTGA